MQVEIPYQVMNSITEVETIPIQRSGGDPLLLRDVAKVSAGTMPGEYDRYNMKRVVSLTANISGEDLGRVAGHVDRAIARAGEPPKGATVEVRGQIAPMNEILPGLAIGLVMAIVVIMLLLTANFQSVRLALVVISTTPAVVAGVVVALLADRDDDQPPVVHGGDHGDRCRGGQRDPPGHVRRAPSPRGGSASGIGGRGRGAGDGSGRS